MRRWFVKLGERWRIYPPTISRAEAAPLGEVGGLYAWITVPGAILNQIISLQSVICLSKVWKLNNKCLKIMSTMNGWIRTDIFFLQKNFLTRKSVQCSLSFLEIGREISWDFPDFLRFLAEMEILDAEEASSQTFHPSITPETRPPAKPLNSKLFSHFDFIISSIIIIIHQPHMDRALLHSGGWSFHCKEQSDLFSIYSVWWPKMYTVITLIAV